MGNQDDFRLRRTFLGLAASIVGALSIALWVQSPVFDPLDLVALPLIMVSFGLLSALIYWSVLAVRLAFILGYSLVAAYLLVEYNYQFHVFVPLWGILTDNVYWFGPLFIGAYLAFPPRLASHLSSLVLGSLLVITLVNFLSQPQLFHHKQLLGNLTQFLTTGLAIVILQSGFGSFRDRMLTMQRAAYQDALTGIANRRAAEEYLRELSAAQQLYSVVMFDLDYFKAVNDKYGHATGDQVLVGVAGLTQRAARPRGLVARWGGEEFLLVLPAQPEKQLRAMLEELRCDLKQQPFGQLTGITACFGVAFAAPHETPEEVIHRADLAMYFVKKRGRNAVQFWPLETPTEAVKQEPGPAAGLPNEQTFTETLTAY